MSNIKEDLLKKMFYEKSLIDSDILSVINNTNMVYSDKLYSIELLIDKLIMLNTRIGTVEQLFKVDDIKMNSSENAFNSNNGNYQSHLEK